MAKTIVPVKVQEKLTVTVTEIRQNGMGIAFLPKWPDYPIYLADALVGEKVIIEIIQVDKYSAYGKILGWKKTSSHRANQGRPYLIEAGTAPLVNWDYQAQKDFKQNLVQKNFAAAGVAVTVQPPITMTTDPTYYRNKTVVPLKWQDGQLLSGFYQRGTHQLVSMEDYYVNDRRIDQVIITVREILSHHRVSAFDPDQEEGAIRYLMVRRGYYSQQLMVVLVSNDQVLEDEPALIADIKAALPDLTSLILNFSPKKDYVLLSPNNRVLWGQSSIEDTLLGKKFLIGPNSFYQVNPVMTEKLYQKAADLAELKASDVVVDAYAGIGTIGISVADRVKEVIGVEVVPGAVADAKKNLALNQIENATYIQRDAPDQFADWQAAGVQMDVVFVDPPRRGLTPKLIEKTVAMGPDRVVYVSCNPQTAARDVALFVKQGYQVKGPVVPVDQFPQTAHIETITVLQKSH